MDTNIEISPQDLLQAVATLSGQQFVAAAMAEAGRLKAMRELAAMQDTEQVQKLDDRRTQFLDANS